MGMSLTAYNRLRKKIAKHTGRKLPAIKRINPLGANLTEQRFNRQILAGKGQFIGTDRTHSFTVSALGSRYTPDFAYTEKTKNASRSVMIEVKGKYRTQKDADLIERRSRIAWEVCAEKYPDCKWVWAKFLRRGLWRVEAVTKQGDDVAVAECRSQKDFSELLRRVD